MSKAKIIALVLGIVLVAGSLFFYSKNNVSAEKIFSRTLEKVSNLKYINEKVEGDVTIKDESLNKKLNLPNGTYPKINFSMDSIISASNWEEVSSDKKSSSSLKISTENMDSNISFDLDFIALKQALFYLKLNNLVGVPFDSSTISGKWWKVDIEALAKNFGGAEAEKILASTKSTQLSKEKIEELKNILIKYKNVAHVEKLADGKIDDTSAYHFSVALDKTQTASMLAEVLEVMQKDTTKKEEIKVSDLEEAMKKVDIKFIDIFIEKTNYLPIQMKTSFSILDDSGKDTGGINLVFTTSASEPIEIKAPENSTDILYLFGNLMSGFTQNNKNLPTNTNGTLKR